MRHVRASSPKHGLELSPAIDVTSVCYRHRRVERGKFELRLFAFGAKIHADTDKRQRGKGADGGLQIHVKSIKWRDKCEDLVHERYFARS